MSSTDRCKPFFDSFFSTLVVSFTGGDIMYKGIKNLLLALLFGLLLPGMIYSRLFPREESDSYTEPPPESVTAPVQTYIPVLTNGEVQIMELEQYVTCVLLKELPSDFHPEAMKAQAVATRTYTLRRYSDGFKHENAAVCTDPGCCQAFRTPEEFLAQGGSGAALQKVRGAAADTSGQVLTYEGRLIEATYFSSSGGRTEAAVAVWGEDIPYLQATESPGEESAAHHTDTCSFSWEQLGSLLEVIPVGNPESRIGQITYTAGGGVDTITICGSVFSGKELRSRLGLRSTAFSIYHSAQGVELITRGFGHRVGMSQYGADAMARQGSDYTEILSHYYTGAQLGPYTES